MTTTTYTLTCLTPVHVGTGVQYSMFDGAYQDRHWHVIDLDKVLARGVDANALARAMNSRTFSWSDWLGRQHMTPIAEALYALPCPQDPEDTPVREAMKTVHQQPYLPGTSVKGALRTAVLCYLLQPQLERAGRSREWLEQPVERVVLGPNPNHDLMRSVHVSDTAPADLERLAVGLIWTYTLRGDRLVEKREQNSEYKTFVEWLTPDTTLRLDIRLDEFLFTDAANRDLRWRGDQTQAVQQLARTCNTHVHTIITAEQQFYATHGLDVLRDYYAELEVTLNALPDRAFLLNIGWGGGWTVKTVGDLLHKALGDGSFRQLRQRYRLGISPRTRQLDLNAPFPKTRRIAYESGAARWALGWVKMEPQEG